MISIAIPTYRRNELLSRVLTQVQRQVANGPLCEVLVIDNDPDASARQIAKGYDGARYIHEPRPGVVHARNKAISAAQGDYIVFLDDDEIPEDGWLHAFQTRADAGDIACFGYIAPSFEGEPSDSLWAVLDSMFSRRFNQRTGADISRYRAYLGTGNSMFKRSVLLTSGTPEPFDPRFNRGGEDVWLLRKLVDEHGITLTWCNEAVVTEIVPSDRMTLRYVLARKYSSGALRCIVERGRGGSISAARVGTWMFIGLSQVVVFGLAGMALRAIGHNQSEAFRARAAAGAGKLLWWRDPRARTVS